MTPVNVTTAGVIASYATTFFQSKALHHVGGNWYVVAQHTAPGVTVYSGGATGASWSELDAANRQAIAGSGRPFDATVYDGKLYVLANSTGAVTYRVYVFDTATGLWTTDLGVVTAFSATDSCVRLLARSNGDLVAVYMSSVDPSDVLCAIWNGAAWTSNVMVMDLTTASTTRPVDAVIDSNDIITVFARDGANADLLYATIDASNTVSAVQTLNASVGGGMMATSQVFKVNGVDTILHPFIDSASDPATYTVTLDGTAPHPTTGPDVVAAKTSGVTAMSTVYANGAPRMIWYDTGLTEINYSTLRGGVWDGLTQLADGTLRWGHAVTDEPSIAYVYHSNTNEISFDRFTPLGASAPALRKFNVRTNALLRR